MADNLIFPVKFDLEAAVKAAQGDADKLLRRLQTTINSKPLAVNLKIAGAGSGSINEINNRLKELVKQWNSLTEAERISNKTSGEFTPQAKKIIAEYTRLTGATESYARTLGQIAAAARRAANEQEKNMEKQRKTNAILQAQENTIDNITAKLKHWRSVLNSSELNGQQFRKAADEVRRLSKELDTAKSKVDAMTGKAKSVNTLTQEFEKQDGYVNRLIKRLAVYASFSAFQTLLTSIREVTAEFELQRVSLGAIIQDQTRANQLFSEIKAFALKSPLKILDLTKYTKQVAAYRIETDKLFDTTKRLADVSVGLGVDMGRLVLAYGQVKAASYLRAAEIRQFTEAGIPMLELLAEKFTKLQGSAVSTEEVMDKVSKRMVSFGMVEEIFKDMTDAGGMFYNMQEKQSQTLYGMWAKMGDAAAVMYEQMGNTATANQGMKDAIQLLSDMMLHWTALANVAQTAAIGILGYKAAMAGLIPFYGLQTQLTVNQIKAEKAKQAQQIKTLAVGRALTREEQLAVMSKNKLMAADYKRLLTEGKLSAAQKLSLGRQAASNVQLRRAVLELNLFTKAQITALGKMSGWQFFWAKFKLQMQGIGQAFVNLSRTMMAFAPLAALTAVIDLFMDWRQATRAQEEAVKKIEKQYEETKVTLMQIENAYRDIQNASKAAGESEEEFAKTSYSQKLEQLQKVIKLLGQFGMKNVIDPSVLDYTNIDPVLDKWLGKLNEVNELARGWGREVALVANAYEGNIFGWSVFGENLKEDMKDLERAWTKLTVNTEFNTSLEQLRAIVGKLSNDNKEVYENISRAIGADLKLALGQKRRNESELQYQQRIYKNYQNIESYLQTYLKKGDYKGMLPSLSSADVGDVLSDFQSQVDEVMHEFDKVKEKFRGQDALTVKMAIDTVAAENDWTEWQKELLIQHLNEDPITLNAEIIPTTNVAGQGAVAEGLKAIITSEFPTLFNENELQSLVSAEGIVDAIKTKLDASNESLEKSVQLQNNIAYGSKGFENSLKRVKQLQDEITEVENMRAELVALEAIEGDKTEEQLLRQSELQAKLAEVDETSINTKRAQIAAIVEANSKYDEQIKKQRESAEAEREIAKAALERVSSMGLSDLGKDVKEQFGGLMVDAVKEMTDKNYSTDFLISDEDLKKVRDVGDLYDTWAKNTKAIKDEKEKLVGVGITEATIEKERAALEEKRAKIQLQLSAVEKEITDEKFKGQGAEYAKLKLALANATTAEAQKTAQENLNKFLGDTKNAEFAILMLKKEGLKTTLQETLVSEAANNQISDYLKGLDDAEKLWEELGKRYNFRLQEKGKKGGSSGEDPWILLMKNRMKFMQDFQKGVEDLSKWMGYTKGLADEQENMLGRGLSLKIDSRQLDGTKEELIKWYEDSIAEIRKKIAQMGGKEWEGLGVQMILAKDTKSRVLKKYQELLADMFKGLTDFRTEQTQKAFEAKIKELADKISRTKTAKEFYEKILSQTGDEQLALNLTTSIYGENGQDLKGQVVNQIRTALGDTKVELPAGIIDAENNINYKELRKFAEKAKETKAIGENVANELIKIADNGEKELSRIAQEGAKLLFKYDEIAQQRVNIEQEASNQIKTLREAEALYLASNATEAEKAAYSKRTNKAVAGVEADRDLKLLKLQDEYLRFFSAIHSLTNKEAKELRTKVREALFKAFQSGAISADELKRELKAVDEQFQKLIDDSGFAMDYLKGGFDGLIQRLKDTADEVQSVAAEISKMESPDQISEGQKSFIDKILGKFGDKTTGSNFADLFSKTNGNLKEMGGLLGKVSGKMGGMANSAGSALAVVDMIIKAVDSTIRGIAQIRDQLNEMRSDDNQLEGGFWDAFEYLENFNKYAASGWEKLKSGDVIGAVADTVSSIISIFGTAQAQKVRKANKEIERQQKLLDQLEYTYGRLEKAADKVFGADFVANQKQQQKILLAQQQAYMKQYEAEMSKGKKADKEKAQEFLDKARDVGDQIADMQGKIAEQMAGTDVASAARDFASAWLEAYASFGNTTDAIREKFNDMIKNMIVESVMAKTVQMALQPMFDEMDKMYKSGASMTDVLSYAFSKAGTLTDQISNGLEVNAKYLESLGINIRDLYASSDNLKGIAKEVGSASSEEINQLSAFVNTALYYVSSIPTISENVSLIRQLMERGTTSTLPDTTAAGWTDWQQQAMDNYNAIARNTADTVVECRRAAVACEAATEKLNRALRAKGATIGFNVFLNS